MDFLTTQVFGHDVERYVRWFVTWGVLCHLTVTKILKRRCGWHTPKGLMNLCNDPSPIGKAKTEGEHIEGTQ